MCYKKLIPQRHNTGQQSKGSRENMDNDFMNITNDDIDEMVEYAKLRLDIERLSDLRTEQKRREQEAIDRMLGEVSVRPTKGEC
jgi:DNA topoisomerase VI subunit B